MNDTLTRYLAGLANVQDGYSLLRVLSPLADRFSSQALNSAGLVISGGGLTVAKIGAADFYACVAGDLVKVAAGTVMPALTGIVIPPANFNVVCFFVNTAGTVTVAAGTAAPTLTGVTWPQFPAKQALIGCLVITSASTFTGGTTALDAATTVYLSPFGGAFDPTVLV